MSDNWIETLQAGHVDLPLTTLNIKKNGVLYEGSGRLVWADHSTIRLSGITNGSAQLFKEFGRFPLPGKLVPHDTYTYGRGTLQNGSDVEIFPVAFPNYKLFDGQEHVAWDYQTHGIKITEDKTGFLRDGSLRIIRIVLQPNLAQWTRPTSVTIENPYFGSSGGSLDWTLIETCIGELAIRKLDASWMEAALFMEKAHEEIELIDIVTAIGRSISFVSGQRVRIAGCLEQTATKETKILDLRYSKVSRNKLLQPLGINPMSFSSYEKMLGSCVNLFLTPLGAIVGQHLYMCWDITDNSYQGKAAVLSICLESLIRLANEQVLQEEYREVPGKDVALKWLESVKGSIDQVFYKRLKGFLGTMHHLRPIDILNKWSETGFLGTTSSDIDAWSDIRNAAAHGRMIARCESGERLQSTVSSLSLINNMINRIVLHFSNYSGTYCDASKLGWPEVEFPKTAN